MMKLLVNLIIFLFIKKAFNHISGEIVSELTSSVVDHGFEPQSGQTKDNKTGISCFFAKHAAFRSKNKNWLTRNQVNVSDWSDMFTSGVSTKWISPSSHQM